MVNQICWCLILIKFAGALYESPLQKGHFVALIVRVHPAALIIRVHEVPRPVRVHSVWSLGVAGLEMGLRLNRFNRLGDMIWAHE